MTKRTRKLDSIGGSEVSARDKVLLSLRLGHSVAASCGAAGVSTSTYFRQRSLDPAFALAADAAKATALCHVESRLLERIEAGDTTATIFFLKSRAGSSWGSGSEINESPELIPPSEPPEVSDMLLR